MTAPADESGWCLSALHDFGSFVATSRQLAISDDGYIYMPYGTPSRYDVATWTFHSGVPGSLSSLGATFDGALAGAPSGTVYGIAHTTTDPRTPQLYSWTQAGGWVHVADLDIGWTLHSIALGRDGNLYVLERLSAFTTVQWIPLTERRFAMTTWTVAGTGWSTSTVSNRLRPHLTSAPPATDLTITWPSTIVPVDAGDSFTFKVGVTSGNGNGFELVQPTVTVQLTRDGVPWGTPASTSTSAAITATGSNPGAGHTIGAVITVHDNGATTGLGLCDIEIDINFGYGLIETYGGATTHRAAKVTTGGTVTVLSALDYARSNPNDYRHITADSNGVVWINMDRPPAAGPDFGVNTTLRRYDPAGPTVTDIGIQAIVDSANDGNTEAYGAIFCDDEDHVLVPMVRYTTLNESWFLRVTPAGVATRIAGTWDAGGSPPPAATATNIADGKVGTSLANEADQGWGISLDGKTLYFFDNSDQAGTGDGNLLRTLTRCPSGGWSLDTFLTF